MGRLEIRLYGDVLKKLKHNHRRRLAYRLAEKAGVQDVDRWLANISPKTFDKWVAFKRIEPDEPARLRSIITRGLCFLIAANGGTVGPDDLDPQLLLDKTEKPFDDVAWGKAFMAAHGVEVE
jgi:hypothetical protein